MTASHDERETYDPDSLRAPVRTQDAPNAAPGQGVRATGAASGHWEPARGAGPDDWLDAAHAYATLSGAASSSAARDGHAAAQPSRDVGAGDEQLDAGHRTRVVTTDAANVAVGLLDEVTKRVMSTDYIDASHVRVAVDGARVTLSGSVVDERSRDRVEQLVAGCNGVQGIDNQLRVQRAAGDR